MVNAITTLRQILIPLFKIQESAWIRKNPLPSRSNRALRTFDKIYDKWLPIKFEEIESVFEPTELILNFSERGKVLYLPPLESQAPYVPILSLYFKLDSNLSIAKFRTMLVCVDESHAQPHGIGFRMETPEHSDQDSLGTANDGIHDFHHAQLIRKFRIRMLDNKLPIDCPSWLPESQPSFPLPAECPVTLLLCLIVTLYGRRYYNQFLDDHQIFDIKRHRKKLDPWINWRK